MALTTRGKTIISVAVVVVLLAAAAIGYFLLTGGGPLAGITGGAGRPKACPLTGVEPSRGRVPERPALAVKIENASVSRPQAGLQSADIVYEQPVEGGITRFIAIFQCRNAERVGPVRSVRESDPAILVQFGSPLFGYAGGVAAIEEAVRDAGIQDLNYKIAVEAYTRDPNRTPPHDLYTTTRALYRSGRGSPEVPEPVFTYEEDAPSEGARRAREVHVNFSPESDVLWRYRRGQNRYLRFHGEEAHTLEDGNQVSSTNVIVQVVQVRLTGRTDPAGNPVPEPVVLGRGQAFVFRNGRLIRGQWIREGRGDITRFEDRQGNEIALAPGTTWVELFPRERFEADGLEFG